MKNFILHEFFDSGFKGINEMIEEKYGIDQLYLTIKLMPVLTAKADNIKKELNKFKSYLVCKLKRGITYKEETNIIQGIYNYVKSDAGTYERMESMNYLFNLKFLES